MTTLPQNDIRLTPKQAETRLWPEPLDTPGLIPLHMKRAATSSFPVLEVLQRLLLRLRPLQSTGSDLEKSLALIGLYQATRPLIKYLKDFLVWAFTVQITIPENDAMSKEILAWMGSEVVNKSRTRSAMLVTGGVEIMHQHGRQIRMTHPPHRVGGRTDTEVSCVPPLGTRVFWIGLRPYFFSRLGDQARQFGSIGLSLNEDGQMQNALTIMTLGWTLAPLNAFTHLCHEFKLKNMTGTTTVYFAGGGYDAYGEGWQSVSKAVRKLDTIDMDPDVKADLVKDAEYYYSEPSRRYFADCGIPYRRGYLFHGPPGTGKTSFTAALAGHLKCDLYHVNLSSGDISDGRLHRLFLSLPMKCIVVIEDIDSAGIGREQGPASRVARFAESETKFDISTPLPNGIPPPPPPPPPLPPIPGAYGQFSHVARNSVTLSGLLNAIDGNASAEGRLLILTSNNPDALDAALTRPGRIDKKVHFGYMSQAAGRSIFMRLIGRSSAGPDAPDSTMEDFATEFATKVPANTFTPAQVQQFLHDCRGDPMKALSGIEAWVENNRGGCEDKAYADQ